MEKTAIQKLSEPTPIFELGKVPKLPHCIIQDRHYDGKKWNYYIYNQYNSYASGWGDEDFIINEIKKLKNP